MTQMKMLFEPSVPVPFDVYGPLPTGVTLLEASAGTGKTFTIAALVARYVAEGLPLERLLVVTFTRMATGELRDRVRQRLVSAATGLDQAMAGVEPADELVAVLAKGKPDAVNARHRRLVTAVAEFDAATIDTTHGFCLHVLMGLGVAGDTERDVKLVEDVSDLLEEVVDDLYVRRFWNGDAEPNFNRAVAMAVARSVVSKSSARLLPELSDERSNSAIRRRLANAVLTEVDRRKRMNGIVTYDDLLTRLSDALGDPTSGFAARSRIASRYEVVLVDEFQDTDPVQWQILDRAFHGSKLVLIGDPKQAIYAFRGADVFAYLNAAQTVETRATLTVNWRSDEGLIKALDAVFAGAQLGQAGIAYYPVEAAPEHKGSGMFGAPHGVPLRVRLVTPDEMGVAKGLPGVAAARDRIARDLADDVRELLSSGAEVADQRGARPVSPGDIAVLVRTNSHASTVRDALVSSGVPAVVAGGGSVFQTEPASEWNRLLSVLEKPTSRSYAAAAALTQFVGWTGDDVAGATEDDWDELHWKLARWSAVLRSRGVAALVEQVTAAGLPARVLARSSGERFLTDLLHVGRLLHAAATEENLGTASLVVWLRRRIREGSDRGDEEMSLRLESDAEAVQVLTIHRSKGLEFPVVYYPYAWDGYIFKDRVDVPVFHDPDYGYEMTVDVGGERVGFCDRTKLQHDEQRGEDLRLLYVALTRAKHQVVLWWVPTKEGGKSPLSRLLFSRDAEGVVSPNGGKTPSDDEVRSVFEGLAAKVPGCISVEKVEERHVEHWALKDSGNQNLEAAIFDRVFDSSWQRTSYSGITASVHEGFYEPGAGVGADSGVRVGSEEEEGLLTDEQVVPAGVASTSDETSSPLLLSPMPGGVEVGSFVHSVLEETDFAAPDLDSELRRAISGATARRAIDVGDPDGLVAGLSVALGTPLGGLASGVSLRDIGRSDRLDELSFELPIAGGEIPHGSVTTKDIARVLRSYCSTDDPVGSYCDRLDDPALDQDVRGYLTGSIDLVFRVEGRKYLIVDYKTNRLAPADQEVSAWHFRPEALAAEMNRAHYPLQAILYMVAFHRYMRWRDPEWDPDRDFAGVLYLFVRGMSAPDFPTVEGEPCGVWSWRPPAGLVSELSDMFDEGGEAR
jgi:exodeoxyribonuclease V beta subunit